MMLWMGKMKRSFFCCLRGGNCKVDVNTRKKCNFCRSEELPLCVGFAFFCFLGLKSVS